MIRSFCVLAASLLACAALATPAPEPFVTGWGRPVDPDRDCKIIRVKRTLTIEMPGTDHDYDPHRNRVNAPRLLREMEGDFEMVQVRTRIDCRPSAQSSVEGQPSYVSAGFLLIPPDDYCCANCIRLEYRVTGQGYGADGCTDQVVRDNEGGKQDGMRIPPDWPFKSKPEYVYQRLERQGEILLYKIGSDGKSWVTVGGGQFIGLPSKLKVGFAACSTSTDPSKVQFDQLWISRGKKKQQ